MQVKLALGMIIIGFIVTGANIMLYFQIEKLIKFLRDYKLNKLMSMQDELQRLEQFMALHSFMEMSDKDKEEFMEAVKKDMEEKDGR